MRGTTITRALASALAVVALSGLAACESGGEPADDPTSADRGSDGGGSEDGGDAALAEDVCTLLTADEVSAAAGRTVTIETGPTGDCEFSEDDPRGVSGNLGFVPDATSNGGYEAYLAGVVGAIPEALRHDVSGLGDAAATYTGVPGFGGSTQVMAGGVVDHGTFLGQVMVSQASDMTAEELEPIAEALLRLLDGKLR